jgi:hypothetical protein
MMSENKHQPGGTTMTTVDINPSIQIKEALQQIGILNPEVITTKQAAAYLSKIKNVPTSPGSMEVYRCQSRGPKYKKIGSRVFYTVAWLDEYAQGVEIKIYDPADNQGRAL